MKFMKNKKIAKMTASKVIKKTKGYQEIFNFMKNLSEFMENSKKSNPLVR